MGNMQSDTCTELLANSFCNTRSHTVVCFGGLALAQDAVGFA